MNPMLSAALGAILRWALTIGGAWLVQHGIWTNAEASVYVMGASLAILSLGWSIWQKKVMRTKFLTALIGADTTEATIDQFVQAGVTASVMTPKTVVPMALPLVAPDPATVPKG